MGVITNQQLEWFDWKRFSCETIPVTLADKETASSRAFLKEQKRKTQDAAVQARVSYTPTSTQDVLIQKDELFQMQQFRLQMDIQLKKKKKAIVMEDDGLAKKGTSLAEEHVVLLKIIEIQRLCRDESVMALCQDLPTIKSTLLKDKGVIVDIPQDGFASGAWASYRMDWMDAFHALYPLADDASLTSLYGKFDTAKSGSICAIEFLLTLTCLSQLQNGDPQSLFRYYYSLLSAWQCRSGTAHDYMVSKLQLRAVLSAYNNFLLGSELPPIASDSVSRNVLNLIEKGEWDKRHKHVYDVTSFTRFALALEQDSAQRDRKSVV